ncbi:DUF523 domain-containing protein [Macrococcus brunensis]|uniref:DUF523 domain-containing protein n=1 Tax=Macrococcus brunensis TaxID=198483 RepID=UPI001EF03465|nr:DUF523 domain-containing protein [Macrococcus brunensis]ULG72476.1 DUF523 domain-containing protein [Macrococcus brunensis]ULG74730.1 DUF523 domain-containing protein [Macrococcus brunensis]
MILISSCLVGQPVRYDGRNQLDLRLRQWVEDGKAMPVCPEVMGGLLVPREPAEIVGGDGEAVWQGDGRVLTVSGQDVTEQFKQGALQTLEICQKHQVTMVILKENSPSCGSHMIYNGQFDGTKQAGLGVTSALLKRYGIQVINEKDPLIEGHCFD